MEVWIYDVECVPNFFSIALEHSTTDERLTFILFHDMIGEDHIDDSLKIAEFLTRKLYLVGYNSFTYDDLLLKFIINMLFNERKLKNKVDKLYKLSKEIISSQTDYVTSDLINRLKWSSMPAKSMDMMRILGLHKPPKLKSLKQTLININWYLIQDWEMPDCTDEELTLYPHMTKEYVNAMPDFDRFVLKEHIPAMIDYNFNDVGGTKAIYKHELPEIRLRFQISQRYRVNVINSDRSHIGDVLLNKYYADATNMELSEFRDSRTHHKVLPIKDVIWDKVYFKTAYFNNLMDELRGKVIVSYSELKQTLIYKMGFEFGAGGLHSVDKPALFKTTDTHIIRDVDADSYYPSLMLNKGVSPRHLGREFLEVFAVIVKQRLEAKKSGDKVTSDGLKITINGTFGKMSSEYKWVYDRMSLLEVTINGQLLLLMLIEQFYEAGIEVISANTDGIVCKIPREKEDIYTAICDEWVINTGIGMDYTDYLLYVRRDVNNYLTVKRIEYNEKKHVGKTVYEDVKGKYVKDVKRKGSFNKDIQFEDLSRGVSMTIVAEAIEEYYVNNIPIEETIRESKDITRFFRTKNTARKYTNIIEVLKDNELVKTTYQKNLRFYVSTKGGTLLKYSDPAKGGDGTTSNQMKGKLVTIMNKIERYEDMSDYHINYPYYISQARKVIHDIEGVTGDLFAGVSF